MGTPPSKSANGPQGPPQASDLNLPVFDSEPLPPSIRSMDEIVAWIDEDYELFFDRDAYEREKRALSVDKPFVL